MSFTRQYGTFAATLVLSLGTAAITFAQQVPGRQDGDAAGVVRIADGRLRSDGQRVQQTGGFHGHMSGVGCPNGTCPPNSGYGAGFNPNGNCPTGNCPAGNYGAGAHFGNHRIGLCPHCQNCFNGRFCEHCCKHSPGYGYTPPAKYPLLRRGVQYDTYYPAQWYGAGGEFVQSSAPMVYQPTDTTQLGFYYKQVPYWQPYPNPLPVRPIPAEWHITPAPVQAYGNSYIYYGPGGHLFHHHHHRARYYQNGYGMNGSCPVDGTWVPQPASPQVMNPGDVVVPNQPTPATGSPEALPAGPESPEELPQTALPPTPSGPEQDEVGVPRTPLPADSASSGHIRRLGL